MQLITKNKIDLMLLTQNTRKFNLSNFIKSQRLHVKSVVIVNSNCLFGEKSIKNQSCPIYYSNCSGGSYFHYFETTKVSDSSCFVPSKLRHQSHFSHTTYHREIRHMSFLARGLKLIWVKKNHIYREIQIFGKMVRGGA